MIIKKFEEQMERFCDRTAVKTAARELTYRQLDEYANRVAHAVIAESDREQQVALLFEHGILMIVGALGTLKAGKTYVPMDISYPEKRLLYLLENSGTYLILTDGRNLSLAQELSGRAGGKPAVLNVEDMDGKFPVTPVQREVSEEKNAYILYTSGSTGKPKGVYQTLRNMWYYTRNWIERFSITEFDRMSLFTSFTHDGAVQDIFAALLSGACLYPYFMKNRGSVEELYQLLAKERITIWHSVPSLYRFFADTLTEKDLFYDIRWVLLGGEPLREHDLTLFKSYFPKALLANVYGQTESSVSTICTISRENTFDDVALGEPLDETEILLVNEDGDIVETMGIGEIVVSGNYIAAGYWQDRESSDRVFTCDDELGRLYWTGDLGRLTAEGFIKMMGRKDFQVKIRGFRVETGEIETALLRHNAVKEVITIAKQDENGDNYLCAYVVSGLPLSSEELRTYLAAELPDYMVPRYFIFLETMPVNTTGKIDRLRLPDPEEVIVPESIYTAPENEIEEKVAAIWQEVLGVEKVGINDNFIELGGHSLLVISIISNIHREFNVELQLSDVFDNPTVKELSRLIAASAETVFSSIEPAEEKEYYPATLDQKRMYILNQLEGVGTTYNLTAIKQLEGELDLPCFEKVFQMLLERHDAFRTSFRMIEDELVQVIYKKVTFQILYSDADTGTGSGNNEEVVKRITDNFVQPFDLNIPPLLRISLVKLAKDEHLLLLDIHHIVSDGVSMGVLVSEFCHIYAGESLPGLKLNYKDYSEWQNRLVFSGQLKAQEDYWLDRLKDGVPVLSLPTNYPRPDVQSFDGDIVLFKLGKELTRRTNQLAKGTGTTLYMVLLAMYNILLNKYTGEEDIAVGSIIAGRNHVDFDNVVGMFVKTLVLRNYSPGNKSFNDFLQEVKTNTLRAFENQEYPFGQLVSKLNLQGERNRNPLFDTVFVLQGGNMTLSENPGVNLRLKSSPYGHWGQTAMFDLYFEALERQDEILCGFQYCTRLFKKETIELMKERFLILIENILDNRQAEIQKLDYSISIEKEMNEMQEVEFAF